MIITIDGPAGSGKSTVARTLAARDGFTYLDTGAMYRCVALAAREHGIEPERVEELAALAARLHITFDTQVKDGAFYQRVFLNGRDVTAAIRTAEVDAAVSAVSAVPAVREAMVAQQRAVGAHAATCVCEGRDMGTVVFPQAEVKIFLCADAAARARRRTFERMGIDPLKDPLAALDEELYQQILRDMERRDAYDSSRDVAPLVAAEDAVLIDSTAMTVEDVLAAIEDQIALVDVAKEEATAAAEAADTVPAHAEKCREKAAPEVPATPAKAPTAGAAALVAEDSAAKPMRAFHNTFDDYFDHAMAEYPAPSRALFATACALGRGWTRLRWPWKFEGMTRFLAELKAERDATGRGVVIVSNHVSMIEPVVTITYLQKMGVPCRAIFKSEFLKNNLFSWAFTRIGGIPVERGEADLEAVRRATAALKRGECLLIYPEGTRVKTDEPAQVHGGFALMAHLAKAAVCPMAVVGARDAKPVGAKHSHNKPVWLKMGRFIHFDELGVKKRRERLEAMEVAAWDAVLALRDVLREEHPGEY